MIDLENPSSTCEPIPDYPKAAGGMALGIIDGKIKSCGDNWETYACYDYDPATNTWEDSPNLLYDRFNAKASFVGGVWLVSGDIDIDDGETTEMWTGSGFEEGPTLPRTMWDHCQLTVNSTHVLFAHSNSITFEPTFLYDWQAEEFTFLEPQSELRQSPSCGVINNPENGLEAVIAQDGRSEILNFGTMTWREGPAAPYFFYAGYAQLFNTFVVVGGRAEDGTDLDTVYKFDHLNYQWIEVEQRLQVQRALYPGVVAVPDDFVSCS